MSEFDIIRAWKNPEYRESLTEEQRSQLPENPAGMVELPDEKMEQISGGRNRRNRGKIKPFKIGSKSICFGLPKHTNGLICIRTVRLGGC